MPGTALPQPHPLAQGDEGGRKKTYKKKEQEIGHGVIEIWK